jgi:hypothetical protein
MRINIYGILSYRPETENVVFGPFSNLNGNKQTLVSTNPYGTIPNPTLVNPSAFLTPTPLAISFTISLMG